jgi:HD-like signal output (HDOD) protein
MGVSHEEIGAYLLGLWGLPEPVVEAVAFHHDLPQLTPPPIGSAVAVAAATFLAHGAAPGTLTPLDPVSDPTLLEVMVTARAPRWRTVAEREAEALSAG